MQRWVRCGARPISLKRSRASIQRDPDESVKIRDYIEKYEAAIRAYTAPTNNFSLLITADSTKQRSYHIQGEGQQVLALRETEVIEIGSSKT